MNKYSLDGFILRITTRYNNFYPYDVYVDQTKEAANKTIKYTLKGGFAVDLFLNLKEFLKFRYVLVPEVGAYNFSLAEKKSIDIFVGSYGLYFDRAKLADATFVTGQSKIVALINHDFEESVQELFSPPFSPELWFRIMLMFFISLIAIGFIGWVEKVPPSDTCFHFIAVVFQNDSSITFNKRSWKVGFLVISTFIMMLMSCYTSNMVSMKAVRRFAIYSIESIVQSRYKILLDLDFHKSSTRILLEALAHIPAIAMLLRRVWNPKYEISSYGKAILEVKKSPTVVIVDEQTGITTIEKELGNFPCSWSSLSVLNLKYPWVMYLRKKSRFKNSINFGLLRLDETGITKRLRQKWIPHAYECKGNLMAFEEISIHQIYYAFFILLGGALVAIFWIIVFERRFSMMKLLFNVLHAKLIYYST